jgi:hypothetical protein
VIASFYMEEPDGMTLSQANHKPICRFQYVDYFSSDNMDLRS